MSKESLKHPAKDDLIALTLGKLDPGEAEKLADHIDSCRDCSQTLSDIKDDTFVSLVRKSTTNTPVEVDESLLIPEDSAPQMTVDLGSGEVDDSELVELPPELRDHPRYEILELIGRGGMGDVYKAQHKIMNRTVALKVIKPALVRNDAAVGRFRREVQAAARLSHVNIVTAHDAEQAGNLHFLVMEYVDGTDLDEVISRKGRLPVEKACDYIRQAAEGLQHAHDLEMVHRDIKPHNLMIEEQTGTIMGKAVVVKILDFGLANFANEVATEELTKKEDLKEAIQERRDNMPPGASLMQLTEMGTMMGTPDYIAPEQAEDAHKADIRADIYSLGCTFYTLLTGRAPFGEGSVVDKIKAHSEQEALPLSEFRDDVPAEVEAVLKKMMAKDPADRYQTPADLAEALATGYQIPESAPQPRQTGSSSPRRRRPLVLTAVATLFLGLILAAGVVIYLATDTGRLEINSDGEIAGARIVLVKDGKEYASFDVEPGTKHQRIRAGEYEVHLRGAPEGVGLKVWSSKEGKPQNFGSPFNPKGKVVAVYRGGGMIIEIAHQTDQRIAGKSAKALPPLTITLNEGVYFLDNQAISPPKLVLRLEKIFKQDPEREVVIKTPGLTDVDIVKKVDKMVRRVGGKRVTWPAWAGSPESVSPNRESAYHILTSDDYEWTEPVNLAAVNGEDVDSGPWVSEDELTLVFASTRAGGFGNFDLWQSTRKNVDDEWSKPVNLGKPINSRQFESNPSLSADGLTIVFASGRPGQGLLDLWISTRDDRDANWARPKNMGAIVNSSRQDKDPYLSPDGLQLIFRSERGGKFEYWITTRKSVDGQWSVPLRLTPERATQVHFPLLDAPTALLAYKEIAVMRWDADADDWVHGPRIGPPINPGGKPYYIAATRTLYFHSTRPGGQGSTDLWMSRRVRKPPAKDEITLVRSFDKGHTGPVEALDWSRDGKLVASGSGHREGDKSARVWDADSGKLLLTIPHDQQVYDVAFSPDNKLLLTGTKSGLVQLWDVSTGKSVRKLNDGPGALHDVGFSPDGRLAVASIGQKIIVWDASTGKIRTTLSSPEPKEFLHGLMKLAVDGDGNQVIAVNRKGDVHVWNLDDAKLLRTFATALAKHPTLGMSLLPDDRHVVVCSHDGKVGTVSMWDWRTGKEKWKTDTDLHNIENLVSTPDGSHVIVCGYGERLMVLETNSGRQVISTKVDGPIWDVAVSPDGKSFLTGDGVWLDNPKKLNRASHYFLRLWRLPESVWPKKELDRVVSLKGHTGPISGVKYSPDGNLAASFSGGMGSNGKVIVWNVAEGKLVQQIQLKDKEHPTTIAFSPDNKRLAIGGTDFQVQLYEGQNYEKLVARTLQPGSINDLGFTRDSGQLLIWSERQGKLWSMADPKAYQQEGLFTARDIGDRMAGKLAFSPNGVLVALGNSKGDQNQVGIIDLKKKRTISVCQGLPPVTDIAFLPDSKRFVVTHAVTENAAALYDITTSKKIRDFDVGAKARGLAVTSDGRHVIIADDTARLTIWEIESGKKVAEFYTPEIVANLDISPDGKKLLTGGGYRADGDRLVPGTDFDVQVWRLPESVWPIVTNFDARIADHQEAILALEYPTPSSTARHFYGGDVVISVGRDRKLNLWNAAALAKGESKITGNRIDEAQGTISCASVAKDGRVAAVGWPELSIVEVWWAIRDGGGSSQRIATIRDSSLRDVEQVLLSPDTQSVYTISPTAGVLWNAAVALPLRSDTEISAAAFGADSRTVVIAGKAIQIYRFNTRPEHVKKQRSLPLPGGSPVCCLALSSKAKRLAVGQEDGTVTVLDVQTGATVCRFTHSGEGAQSVTDLEFHATDRVLVAAVGGRRVHFWDVETKQLTFEALARPGTARNICVSPDGKLLIAAGGQTTDDDAVYLWRLPESVWPNRKSPRKEVVLAVKEDGDQQTLEINGEKISPFQLVDRLKLMVEKNPELVVRFHIKLRHLDSGGFKDLHRVVSAVGFRNVIVPPLVEQYFQRKNKLTKIGLALHAYHGDYEQFPPSPLKNRPGQGFDKEGRPPLSWRVHLLPYLGEEKLFKEFRLDEAWDSDNNKKLLARMPDVFKTTDHPTKTTFLAVVGKGTAYEGKMGLKISSLIDGASTTVIAVDAGPENAIPWTKPEDLPFDSKDPMRPFGRFEFGEVFLALFGDGQVKGIRVDIAPESMRALFTRAENDKFNPNKLRIDKSAPTKKAEAAKIPVPTYLATLIKLCRHDKIRVPLDPEYQALKDDLRDPIKKKLLQAFAQLPDESHQLFLRQGYLKWPYAKLDEKTQAVFKDLFQRNQEAIRKQGSESPFTLDDLKKADVLLYIGNTSKLKWVNNYLFAGVIRGKRPLVLLPILSAKVPKNFPAHTISKEIFEGKYSPLPKMVRQTNSNRTVLLLKKGGPNLKMILDGREFLLAGKIVKEISNRFKANPELELHLEGNVDLEDQLTRDLIGLIQKAGIQRIVLPPAVMRKMQEAARRLQLMNNLKQIGVALHGYHDHRGSFPPSRTLPDNHFAKDGKPLLSWRVYLLPYLEQDKLYKEFRLNEPWDSKHNSKLLAKMPPVFKTTEDATKTTLLAVVGKGTAYQGKRGLTLKDLGKDRGKFIYAIIAGADKAVPWTKPADLPLNSKAPDRMLGKINGGSFLALFCDGGVRPVRVDRNPSAFRALFTKSVPNSPNKLKGANH